MMQFNTQSTVTYFYYFVNRCRYKLNDLRCAFILNMQEKIKEKAFELCGSWLKSCYFCNYYLLQCQSVLSVA